MFHSHTRYSLKNELDKKTNFLHHLRGIFTSLGILQLHEQTKRFLLLLCFYLFGPILSLGIIGGVALRKMPFHARHWEQTLSQQTGLHWNIQSVEYRSPYSVRLHHVQILDTHLTAKNEPSPVFQAKTIDIQRINGIPLDDVFPNRTANSPAQEYTGLTAALARRLPALRSKDWFWKISVPISLLDFKAYSVIPDHNGHSAIPNHAEHSAPLVQNMVQKVFARIHTLADVPILFELEQVALRSEHSLKRGADQVDLIQSVHGNLYQTPDEIRSDWAFHIRGISDFDQEQRERVSFVFAHRHGSHRNGANRNGIERNDISQSGIDRNGTAHRAIPGDAVGNLIGGQTADRHTARRPTFEVSFQTGRQPIPCDLINVFASSFQQFSGGSFRGTFSLTFPDGNRGTPTIRLEQANFYNVSLGPLASRYTDFTVSGTVTNLRLHRAVFGHNGMYAEGYFKIEHGQIATELFMRCVDRFHLNVLPARTWNYIQENEKTIHAVPFSESAIHFRLQPEGISFWPEHYWADTFMYYLSGSNPDPILRVQLPANRRMVSYHELMSIFAPNAAPTVPLTPGLQSLLPHIPIMR